MRYTVTSIALLMCVIMLGALLPGCSEDNGTDIDEVHTPAAPSGLYAISGDEEVSLGWQPSADEDEKWFDGYNIYYDMWSLADEDPEALDDYMANLVPLTATSGTVDALVNGTKYYFHVRAVSDDGGYSDPSNEVIDAGRRYESGESIGELYHQTYFSGYDLSESKALSMSVQFLPNNADDIDIFLDGRGWSEDSLYVRSPDTGEYYQDDYEWRKTEIAVMGEYEMDSIEVQQSPGTGYDEMQLAQIGYVYALKVQEIDGIHYVKMRITEIIQDPQTGSNRIVFEYAYQGIPNYPNF